MLNIAADKVSRRLCSSIFLSVVCTMFVVALYQGGHFTQRTVFENDPTIQFDCNKLFDSTEDNPVDFIAEKINLVQDDTKEMFGSLLYRPLLNCLEHDHDVLLESLKKDILIHPSNKEYNLIKPRMSFLPEFSKDGETNVKNSQAMDIYNMIFKDNIKNGFFIEAGALDCETDSVTLPFERDFNWTGVLVEPVPILYNECLKKNRKAFLMQNCLGTMNRPHFTAFNPESVGNWGMSDDQMNATYYGMAGIVHPNRADTKIVKMQCIPLYSILLAVGNPTVNFMVLDVEGAELAVLKTIPWEKVDIEVMSIETNLAGKVLPGTRQDIIQLMEKAGYKRFNHNNDYTTKTKSNQNDLFVRNDIVEKYNVVQKM